jgi:hypothetical protein
MFDYGSIVNLTSQDLWAFKQLMETVFMVVAKLHGHEAMKQRAESIGRACGVHIIDWDTSESDLAGIVGYLTAPGEIQLDESTMRARRTVAARISGPALRLMRSLLLVDGVCRSLDSEFAWRVK